MYSLLVFNASAGQNMRRFLELHQGAKTIDAQTTKFIRLNSWQPRRKNELFCSRIETHILESIQHARIIRFTVNPLNLHVAEKKYPRKGDQDAIQLWSRFLSKVWWPSNKATSYTRQENGSMQFLSILEKCSEGLHNVWTCLLCRSANHQVANCLRSLTEQQAMTKALYGQYLGRQQQHPQLGQFREPLKSQQQAYVTAQDGVGCGKV